MCDRGMGVFSGAGCTIGENPLSMDGWLLERMDSRQWIIGSSKILVLGQRGWMRDRKMGGFPGGSFQARDSANKTASPDFAGEPRVD